MPGLAGLSAALMLSSIKDFHSVRNYSPNKYLLELTGLCLAGGGTAWGNTICYLVKRGRKQKLIRYMEAKNLGKLNRENLRLEFGIANNALGLMLSF